MCLRYISDSVKLRFAGRGDLKTQKYFSRGQKVTFRIPAKTLTAHSAMCSEAQKNVNISGCGGVNQIPKNGPSVIGELSNYLLFCSVWGVGGCVQIRVFTLPHVQYVCLNTPDVYGQEIIGQLV